MNVRRLGGLGKAPGRAWRRRCVGRDPHPSLNDYLLMGSDDCAGPGQRHHLPPPRSRHRRVRRPRGAAERKRILPQRGRHRRDRPVRPAHEPVRVRAHPRPHGLGPGNRPTASFRTRKPASSTRPHRSPSSGAPRRWQPPSVAAPLNRLGVEPHRDGRGQPAALRRLCLPLTSFDAPGELAGPARPRPLRRQEPRPAGGGGLAGACPGQRGGCRPGACGAEPPGSLHSGSSGSSRTILSVAHPPDLLDTHLG